MDAFLQIKDPGALVDTSGSCTCAQANDASSDNHDHGGRATNAFRDAGVLSDAIGTEFEMVFMALSLILGKRRRLRRQLAREEGRAIPLPDDRGHPRFLGCR